MHDIEPTDRMAGSRTQRRRRRHACAVSRRAPVTRKPVAAASVVTFGDRITERDTGAAARCGRGVGGAQRDVHQQRGDPGDPGRPTGPAVRSAVAVCCA